MWALSPGPSLASREEAKGGRLGTAAAFPRRSLLQNVFLDAT